jgi:beta-galactosidase
MTSVEFECGDGNYGSNLGGRYDPSAADFKTRLCVAQGARLINYYLFTGGRNYRLSRPPGDGQDRIAFTGERHGFAAPVSPEGEPNYTFPRMARAVRAVAALGAKLAAMEEEHDGVAWGFIPDYWMTEHRYPKSEAMRRIVSTLETHRGYAAWETVARAMLMAGYRFGAVDVQRAPLAPSTTPVLVLPTARYLDEPTQRRVAAWLRDGGRLLLWGEVPFMDFEERPCTVLADALGPHGLRPRAPDLLRRSPEDGSRRDLRSSSGAQALDASGATTATVLMRLYGGGEVCGVDVTAGAGRAVVLSAGYATDVPMFRLILETLGAAPGLTNDCPWYGIIATTGRNAGGERVLHLLNLDGFDKDLAMAERGVPLFDGRRLTLRAKEGAVLPLGVRLDPRLPDVTIAWSTAEVMEIAADRVEFRRTQPEDTIVLETRRRVLPGHGYRTARRDGRTVVTSLVPACVDDRLVVRLGR